ncbi:L-lactate permease [Phycicoccus sonneratiae]|uniref:L-lactate permease n=1 Tax=Phycicoccus sonneratiae TaxID=2807628 RepID=A0ABS2CJG8_9MICO|nr:L-lactate permease [Phycicoccus sonneraticus]MBM6399983.1 L-lactate permease [Phycicoccus sonneraticus]
MRPLFPTAGPAPAASVPGVPVGHWLLAVSPVVVLLLLVLWGRLPMWVNAVVTVAWASLVAWSSFGAGTATVLVGLGKGAWVGVWILYVIGPALLVHHLASSVGMTALGRVLAGILPTRTENVLLLAWVLPSFIQGVSGFGTPIAVAAPLLVALGVGRTRAVALPLVGYHWAVGFGSMGSSFYMGALTAHLDGSETAEYAAAAALALGVNCLLSGLLVALMSGGRSALREAWPMLVTVGPAMALVQAAVVRVEPGIGALCGGAAGVAVVFLLRRLRGGSAPAPEARDEVVPEERGRARAAVVPYVLLAAVALAVFLPPPVRAWAKGHLLLGPSFPATSAADGVRTAAVDTYNPIAVVGHPGTFLLVACLGSVLVWRWGGRWPHGSWGPVWRGALRQLRKSSPSVVLLASVAGVLVDSGMVTTVARGAAAAAGSAYPAVAPLVGALGSFVTGSTTSSNALFSALQAEVATLTGAPRADLLAGQLAGGNIGNSLAPVVIVLGLSAVGGDRSSAGRVLRTTLLPAAVLLAATVAVTSAVVALHA